MVPTARRAIDPSSRRASSSSLAGCGAWRPRDRGPRYPHDDRLPAAHDCAGYDGRGRVPRRWLHASGHEPRRPAGGELSELSRHGRIRSEVPARAALQPSDRNRRRTARHPDRARKGCRVEHRAGSHRHHGIFGGRTSGGHGIDALRRRQARRGRSARQAVQPPGFRGARLPGDIARRPRGRIKARGRICWAITPIPNWQRAFRGKTP